jgi:anti-sigma factor RsiW
MKAQLSPKDWQQISEYLDDQLTPKEKNRLEERIRVRPELRNGLEELRHTRLVLRSVPKRRAPHNFTLTPEMVRPRSISRLFPVLSFSSALATILIVVTLV